MNTRKALVLTYHVKNSTRVGGFRHFIEYLCRDGFDVDWVPLTVSSTWLIRHNDKENFRNFFDLLKGIEFEQFGAHIRYFSVPVWLPAKLARMFNLPLGTNYWPKWEKLRNRLYDDYDVILVEGVACQYADDLRNEYPNARIVYRPSDILCMFSDIPNPEQIERRMIEISDQTLCVDETCLKYYRKIAGEEAEIDILRNPLTTDKDLKQVENYRVKKSDESIVLYIGVSYFDADIVEYAAQNNPSAKFIIVGPWDKKTHDNIIYTGILAEREYNEFLKKACVGISPLNSAMIDKDKGIAIGYTRKIINYMKYLMPVVATCSVNYLGIDGFLCVDGKEEFAEKISECLKYSIEDREKLRADYLKVMKIFSEKESKEKFLGVIHNNSSYCR